MKIRVTLAIDKEYEVNNETIEKLYQTHQDPDAVAPQADYEAAAAFVTELTGVMPYNPEHPERAMFLAVYSPEDGVPILEY